MQGNIQQSKHTVYTKLILSQQVNKIMIMVTHLGGGGKSRPPKNGSENPLPNGSRFGERSLLNLKRITVSYQLMTSYYNIHKTLLSTLLLTCRILT